MCSHSVGNPSECPQHQGPVCGEKVHDGGPTPWAPLNNDNSLPRQSVLPPGSFPALELLTPIPTGCLHTAELLTPTPSGHFRAANSSPLPRPTLVTRHFSTQPPPIMVDTSLRLGHAGLWYRPSVQVLLYPACHRAATALSSNSSQSFPSISGYFPPVRGCSNLSSPSSPLQGCGSHPVSSFLCFPFLFFILPSYSRIFSCPFMCLRSSASIQLVLCVNFSTCRCILDVLVGRSEPQALLFHHLDHSLIFKCCLFFILTFIFSVNVIDLTIATLGVIEQISGAHIQLYVVWDMALF